MKGTQWYAFKLSLHVEGHFKTNIYHRGVYLKYMCRYFKSPSKDVLKINMSNIVAITSVYMNLCLSLLEKPEIYSKILILYMTRY